MQNFEIQRVFRSSLPGVAEFLYRWRCREAENAAVRPSIIESAQSIERRLHWLLQESPAADENSPLGYCLRDGAGIIRGLNLFFPAAFLAGERRLVGLCSGSFFVEPSARSMGFYLFKKYLHYPGYSFYFATTCNANSGALWRTLGGCAVPRSAKEYILPLRLDGVISTLAATRTSNKFLSQIARVGGRCANPVLQFLARPSTELNVQPCHDWEKLSELFRRNRALDTITTDRTARFLQWRYGPTSPTYECGIYLIRDKQGNEGWVSLGNLRSGATGEYRRLVLLDAIWPRGKMNFKDIFQQILGLATDTTDAIYLRWHPGVDVREYCRWVIRYRLPTPRAFVIAPKDAPLMALDSLDYDDSDYVAWRFHWPDPQESSDHSSIPLGAACANQRWSRQISGSNTSARLTTMR